MEKVFGKEGQDILIITKEIIETIKNGDKESTLGLLGTFIKEVMKQMQEMDMDKCIGRMEAIIKELGLMAFSMVRVFNRVFRIDFHSY